MGELVKKKAAITTNKKNTFTSIKVAMQTSMTCEDMTLLETK